MRVLVTGANGFIGRAVTRHLAREGWRVAGAMRVPGLAADWPWLERVHAFALNQPLATDLLRDVEGILHMAHDFRPGSEQVNFEGTMALVRAARGTGVAYQVYLSSYSAHDGAVSEYGRTKRRIEVACLDAGCAVVRPGLVVGAGGIYRRMAGAVAHLPVLPLIGGSRVRVPFVSVQDLARVLTSLLQRRATGAYNVFAAETVSLKDLLAATARALGRRPLMVPFPASPVVKALQAAEALGLRLPVTSGNVLGLVGSQQATHRSDLAALLAQPMSLELSVSAALSQEQFP